MGIMENRRLIRKIRQQDFWLAFVAIGIFFLVLAMPALYEFMHDVGTAFGEGETGMLSALDGFIAVSWVMLVALGVFSGVTSEGELSDQEALLTIRPPKDVAGGLVAYVLIGYAPVVFGLGGVAGAGLAIGAGSPLAIVSILVAGGAMLVTGVIVGYVAGLVLKGVVRRSPWLTRLKPVLGVGLVFGYFWLSFTGRFWSLLSEVGALLEASPLRWYGDLAFVLLSGADPSIGAAAGMLVISLIAMPIGVLAVGLAGEFAWYVDRAEPAGSGRKRSRSRGATRHVDRVLQRCGVHSSTRGVVHTVLVRGYRAPLHLVYVSVPLLLLIPILESVVRTGAVPEWMPWMVMAYGGWAAGVSFPLNILGTQGPALPRILTSPVKGRRIVNGYVIATSLVFVPLTVAFGLLAGSLADRPVEWLIAFAVGGVVIVGMASVLSAGIGAMFPRFASVELTEQTDVTLPSKFAFILYSFIALLLVHAVGVFADELFRLLVSSLLSTYLPFGLTISADGLYTASLVLLGVALLATPVTYLFASRRIGTHCIS